jgi:hypothetical protein
MKLLGYSAVVRCRSIHLTAYLLFSDERLWLICYCLN